MSKEQFIEKYGEECYYYSHPIIHKCTIYIDSGYGPVSKYYVEPVEPIYSDCNGYMGMVGIDQ